MARYGILFLRLSRSIPFIVIAAAVLAGCSGNGETRYEGPAAPPAPQGIPAPPPPPLPQPQENRGAIDPRTGEYLPPSGSGVFNPRTGEYYPPAGSGYINPRTGEFIPRRP